MTCNAINIKYKLSHALKEDEDDSQVDLACKDEPKHVRTENLLA
jgi:hypothetical protein